MRWLGSTNVYLDSEPLVHSVPRRVPSKGVACIGLDVPVLALAVVGVGVGLLAHVLLSLGAALAVHARVHHATYAHLVSGLELGHLGTDLGRRVDCNNPFSFLVSNSILTLVTIPASSWPGTHGYCVTPQWFSARWTSVWQMPQNLRSNSTSSGPRSLRFMLEMRDHIEIHVLLSFH